MSSDAFNVEMREDMDSAFPNVDPGIEPLGARVVVQLRRTSKKTKSGLVLVEETRDTVKWNNQVAKVVKVGPLAFRNRETRELWPEGAWLKEGDFVKVPRWNGDRTEIPVKDSDEPITFVVFNDHEMIARITGNPLDVKAYIL